MIHGEYRDLKALEAMMYIHSDAPGGGYSLALAMLAVAQALQDQRVAIDVMGKHIEELASAIYLHLPKEAA
jgi:DNA-binding IclR family transcriptional regulator